MSSDIVKQWSKPWTRSSNGYHQLDEDHLNDLPDELLLKILSRLSTRDLIVNVSRVSQRLYHLSKHSAAHKTIDLRGVNLLRHAASIMEFLEGKTHIRNVYLGHSWDLQSSLTTRRTANEEIDYDYDTQRFSTSANAGKEDILHKFNFKAFYHHLLSKQEHTSSMTLIGNAVWPFILSDMHHEHVQIDHLRIAAYYLHDNNWLRTLLKIQMKKLSVYHLDAYDRDIFFSIISDCNFDILKEMKIETRDETYYMSLNKKCLLLATKDAWEGQGFLSEFLHRATAKNAWDVIKFFAGKDSSRVKQRILLEKGKNLYIRCDQETVPLVDVVLTIKLLRKNDWLPNHCTIKYHHYGPKSTLENEIEELRTILPPDSNITLKRHYVLSTLRDSFSEIFTTDHPRELFLSNWNI